MRALLVGQVDEVGQDVPLQVIDLHQRDVLGHGESLGERNAHQQRPQQTGAPGKGDGVHIVDRQAGILECGIDHGHDVLLMGPRGQFGNHTAVLHVHGLRGDDIGEHRRTAQHGGRGVVTGRLDTQYDNIR